MNMVQFDNELSAPGVINNVFDDFFTVFLADVLLLLFFVHRQSFAKVIRNPWLHHFNRYVKASF